MTFCSLENTEPMSLLDVDHKILPEMSAEIFYEILTKLGLMLQTRDSNLCEDQDSLHHRV